MSNRRVLIIGQLPKEAGGTYTTGIARVVENLYQKRFGDIETYWYFTNVPYNVAKQKNLYGHQYNGFKKMPLRMLWNLLRTPLRTWREWQHYKKIDHVNPLRFEFYKSNFQKVLKEVHPDLIHLHGAGLSPLYYANKGTGIPIMLTFHGVMYNERDKDSWHFKAGYEAAIGMAEYFTVLNQETKRKALGLGMPEDKCVTIPNGVDAGRFYYSVQQRHDLRMQYGVDDDTLVFITTGVVIDRKGQYDFLRVLAQLGVKYQYWIVGKGPDEQKILNFAKEHHIESKVRLLGYIDGRELYKYLSAADVYAHVSTTEGQALSEIEAFATGLRTIVRKEISGTVIGDASSDHSQYYTLDMEHVEGEQLRAWLSEGNGNRHSRGNYDWELVAQEYGKLYDNILSKQ